MGSKRPNKKSWRGKVIARDGASCIYCEKPLSVALRASNRVTLDHLIPQSENGADHAANLVIACKQCNEARGSIPFQDFASDAAIMRIIRAMLNCSVFEFSFYSAIRDANLKAATDSAITRGLLKGDSTT